MNRRDALKGLIGVPLAAGAIVLSKKDKAKKYKPSTIYTTDAKGNVVPSTGADRNTATICFCSDIEGEIHSSGTISFDTDLPAGSTVFVGKDGQLSTVYPTTGWVVKVGKVGNNGALHLMPMGIGKRA